jgi:hypothetical protein
MTEQTKESKFKLQTSALRAYTMIAALAFDLDVFSLGNGMRYF